MPVTPHGISYLGLLLFHKQRHYLCPATFRPRPVIDPYIRRFVSAFSSCVVTAHSDHRHFVGLRHIAYIACLQATFVILLLRYASADFTELLTLLHLPCIHASRSIKVALWGVTPSFDYSHIQFSSCIVVCCACSFQAGTCCTPERILRFGSLWRGGFEQVSDKPLYIIIVS